VIGAFHRFTPLGIAVVAFAAVWASAPAASSPQQATVQGLVGTWSCITHTADNKTYHETDVDTMFGKWLKISASYSAQNGGTAGNGVTFVSYDTKTRRWIVTGASTDGAYFMATSASPNFDGSKWTDQYPNDHGTAVLHLTPYTKYTMEMTGPNEKGKMTTSRAVCTKQ
jgi:hypothetical protein